MRIKAPRWFEQFRWFRALKDARAGLKVRRWNGRGRPVPPPSAFKQDVLRAYGRQYGLKTLVETGTLHGDTLFRLVDDFDRLYSIELSPELHAKARERFRRFPKISLIQGDSGVKIAEVVAQLDAPALFWLDGHYSSGETAKAELETPILEELRTLFHLNPRPPVLLIDDARLFGTDQDYPSIPALREFVAEHGPGWKMEIADDIIRLTPPA